MLDNFYVWVLLLITLIYIFPDANFGPDTNLPENPVEYNQETDILEPEIQQEIQQEIQPENVLEPEKQRKFIGYNSFITVVEVGIIMGVILTKIIASR